MYIDICLWYISETETHILKPYYVIFTVRLQDFSIMKLICVFTLWIQDLFFFDDLSWFCIYSLKLYSICCVYLVTFLGSVLGSMLNFVNITLHHKSSHASYCMSRLKYVHQIPHADQQYECSVSDLHSLVGTADRIIFCEMDNLLVQKLFPQWQLHKYYGGEQILFIWNKIILDF